MNSNRKSKEYNEIVGILKGGQAVVLEDTFTYGDNNTHGAAGVTFCQLTQGDIDAMLDPDMNEMALDDWRTAVGEGNTTDSYKDYFNAMNENLDYRAYCYTDDPSFRESMDEAYEKLSETDKKRFDQEFGEKGKDFVDWDNISCGSCIELDPDEYALLLRPDLLEIARKAEEQGVVED